MENKEELLPSWYKMENESDSNYSHFEYYRTMPPSERSLAECERRLGFVVGNSHIRKIYKQYNWFKRARDWDNYLASMKDKAMVEQVSEVKIEYVEHARAVRIALLKPVEELYSRIREKPDFFKNMDDKELIRFVGNLPDKLKRIQEVELTAYGHATEITKNDVDVKSNGKSFIIEFSDDVEDENDDD